MSDRLPDLALHTTRGVALDLRSPQGGAPLIVVPPTEPDGSGYERAFGHAGAGLRLWDARPILIVRSEEEVHALDGEQTRLDFVIDEGSRLRDRLGVPPDHWGVFIADRWGVLYQVVRARDAGELPDIHEIEEWAKFLATQCPECGVIDDPDPGWGV